MQATAHRKSGVVVPRPLKWHGRLAAGLVYALARSLAGTVRFQWEDRTGLLNHPQSKPVIFSIWHNRLALCLELYRQYVQGLHPERRMAAIVSASRDGGLLARVLELYRVQPVRGSTSRRGPQAMLEMTSWAEKGYDIAITPDGPRGPRYVMQEGPIVLARLTGMPIIPVSYRLAWKKTLKTWDQFQVPFPATRCEVILGEPIHVAPDITDAEREILRQKLQTAMAAITHD
jgi:lysophospholipid acyltransferase (LPLAT)-like uncharacterized protein